VIKEGSFLALQLSSVLNEGSATKSECRKDRFVGYCGIACNDSHSTTHMIFIIVL
jgi:hypothetical protein